jgi:hypothetical protein
VGGPGLQAPHRGLNSERIVVGLEGVGVRTGGTRAGDEVRPRARGLRPAIGQNQAVAHPAGELVDPPGVGLVDGDARLSSTTTSRTVARRPPRRSVSAPKPASMPVTGPCPRTVATPTRSDWPGSAAYAGGNSATRDESTRIERVHPIRSAITVAGIVGYALSNSPTPGSPASTIDPVGLRHTSPAHRRPTPPAPCSSKSPYPRDLRDRHLLRPAQSPDLCQSSTLNTHSSLARWEPGSSGR